MVDFGSLTTLRVSRDLVPRLAIVSIDESLVSFVLSPGKRSHVFDAFASGHPQDAIDVQAQHFFLPSGLRTNLDSEMFRTRIGRKCVMHTIVGSAAQPGISPTESSDNGRTGQWGRKTKPLLYFR